MHQPNHKSGVTFRSDDFGIELAVRNAKGLQIGGAKWQKRPEKRNPHDRS
jgi:hypothetical protein